MTAIHQAMNVICLVLPEKLMASTQLHQRQCVVIYYHVSVWSFTVDLKETQTPVRQSVTGFWLSICKS